MNSSDYVVSTAGLVRRFGSVTAVDGIDLQVPRGSVYGFLGPNGAGKTTTLRMLLGLIRPQRGTIELDGCDLGRERYKALGRVGAIIETPALYPNLTAREQLRLSARLRGAAAGRVTEMLELVDLCDAADRPVHTYSLGMRQRLALAKALVAQPRLLILDEPTNGMDPSGIVEMRRLIRELPIRSGATVLLSSHHMPEIEQTADHCALIEKGRLIYQGRLDHLLASATPRIILETDKPDSALDWFRARGIAAELSGAEVHAAADLAAGERAAMTAALVASGVGVSGLRTERPALETMFLQMISSRRLPA